MPLEMARDFPAEAVEPSCLLEEGSPACRPKRNFDALDGPFVLFLPDPYTLPNPEKLDECVTGIVFSSKPQKIFLNY